MTGSVARTPGLKLSTLAYVRRAGKTLMLMRPALDDPDRLGRCNGLGGKFLPGETPEECMRREVLEESGLTVLAADLRGLLTFPRFDGVDDWYVFVFVVTAFAGEPVASPEGELLWHPTNRLTELPLWPGDRHFLPWLELQGSVFSARFDYQAGEYVGHVVEFYPRFSDPLR